MFDSCQAMVRQASACRLVVRNRRPECEALIDKLKLPDLLISLTNDDPKRNLFLNVSR